MICVHFLLTLVVLALKGVGVGDWKKEEEELTDSKFSWVGICDTPPLHLPPQPILATFCSSPSPLGLVPDLENSCSPSRGHLESRPSQSPSFLPGVSLSHHCKHPGSFVTLLQLTTGFVGSGAWFVRFCTPSLLQVLACHGHQ